MTSHPLNNPRLPDGGLVRVDKKIVLNAHGLAMIRRDQWLFRGIDISLRPGDALRIEGANGSGKSTLLRLLAGLLLPTEGGIERSGAIGWVGHENGFTPHYTLREELTFWLGDVPKGPTMDFDMRPLLDVDIATLSQGQKRRAALWRLLAEEADIWLLDEPAAGLDARSLTLFSRAIADFRKRGGIVVAATHGETAMGEGAVLRLGTADA